MGAKVRQSVMQVRIRPIGEVHAEVRIVVERMRETLGEVIGDDGRSMYELDWIEKRLRWHIESAEADVFVADSNHGLLGHTIVRVDLDDTGKRIGLFSTIYVAPVARRLGVARALIERGERWMRARGLDQTATYTHEDNTRLHALFRKRGYDLVPGVNRFVKLSKKWRPQRPTELELVAREPWSWALFRQRDGAHWLYASPKGDPIENDLDLGIVRLSADEVLARARQSKDWAKKLAQEVSASPADYLDRVGAAEFHVRRNGTHSWSTHGPHVVRSTPVSIESR